MVNTIRQLQDLKEWSQDSTRYERRLNFRLASKPYNWEEGDWWDLDDESVGNTKILEDFEITDEMRRRPNAEGGVQQLVQPGPGRPGYAGDDHHSFKPLTTATEKAHYERQYGKKYNVDDWKKGNFTKKEKFSSGKKKIKKDPIWKRADFRSSFNKYLKQETGFTDLAKRGYISISQLNKLLGGKDTQQAIDTLSSGLKHSPWVEEIEGVKKWKKSRLQTELSMIDEGGKVFYKMPDKETLKGLKSYYKNQEYLSDFKQGRIKGNTIKNVQMLYDDDTLMKAIKKWTIKDKKVPLKIIETVFGGGTTGPSSVMQLGRALKGDIKIPGVRKNVALGNKIIEAMAWESRKGRGPWQNATYEYAKAEMDNLYKTKGKEWNFNQYYRETRNLLNKLGVKDVIDEVSALRSGWTNNNQIYSTFKQVIDKKINDSFKSGYDARFSTSQGKVQKLLADKPPGWQDEVKRLTGLQEGSYKRAKLKYPKIEFATFGEFDETTGKFAKPEKVFGERFAELPSEIQKGIRKSFRDTGVSLNVGQTKTQQELFKTTLNRVKKELPDIFKAYRANGIGKSCPIGKAEGGRIGFAKAGVVDDNCMRNAINEHKRKLADGNEAAITKQIKINQTKGLKNMFTMGRRGAQGIIGFVGGKWGVALEAALEAAFYGYGRQQGESHEQARENLFFPKILEKMVPDVVKDTELWKKYGIKPFKTGVWEGPEKLIEEELIGTRWDPSGKVNLAAEYADGMKALEDEYANASKIDFELGVLNNQWRPGSEEEIEAKEQELKDSYDRIEQLQINIKEDTPAYNAYVAAQEKQKALRDERALDPRVIQPSYSGSKERQWRDEFLDYRGADRKYRKEQPFAFKGGLEGSITGPNQFIDWDAYADYGWDKPEQKWSDLYETGGWDLMDKIGIAGGVANMAGGGIAGLSGGKRFGPPPVSGPVPQGGGLSSQFNRVRKLQG
jgi:hypothetical protein